MTFLSKPSFLFGVAYYVVISLMLILFASPLFAGLGFEYSGFIALAASLHLLFYTATQSASMHFESAMKALNSLLAPVLCLISVPLLISMIAAIFVPNCSLGDGVLFYLEIVIPTALVATLCGVRFGNAGKSRRRTLVVLALFWTCTLLISLLPGYFSSKIYTYGWQYGYFPGLVWDEVLELHPEYWISRAVEMAAIISWIFYDERFRKNDTAKKKFSKLFFTPQYWALTICVSAFGIYYFIQYSNIFLTRELNLRIKASEVIYLHLAKGTLRDEELKYYCSELRSDLQTIDSSFGISSQKRIDIYIFSSPSELYRFVGTREASITKPWQRSIFITKQNLHSLGHELAHAILSEYGSKPFDMSWSTGLTEGAAVSIEVNYDGIHSTEELASNILRLHLANGVENIMGVSGFLNSAPSVSYVLSGSFSKYLREQYGGAKFLTLYNERDFEMAYAKPIPVLEAEWRSSLPIKTAKMDHYDSLRTRFYFERTSILRQPCLRRIGKLMQEADRAFDLKNYILADSLYAKVIAESGRIGAIRGRIRSQLMLGRPVAALAILDTTAAAGEAKNLTALHLLRGDVIILAGGALEAAHHDWSEAMRLKLNDASFEAAFIRSYFFEGTNNLNGVRKLLQEFYGIEEVKSKYDLLFSIEPVESDDHAAYSGRLYLYCSYFERAGQLSDAVKIWTDGIRDLENIRSKDPGFEEELFEKLVTMRYKKYQEALSVGESESRIFP
ncbi:MAG: hypothetical protein ABI778_04000 [Ignavibacteriota bacterium]